MSSFLLLTDDVCAHRIACMSKIDSEGLWTPESFNNMPLRAVANGTLIRADRYFKGTPFIGDKTYLKTRTLPVINSARKGLIANPNAVRNLGLIDPETLEAFEYMVKDEGEGFEATKEDFEAFSRMQLAFGRVPEMAMASGYPDSFPRRVISPPFTVAEVFGRIHEVERTIERIIDDKFDPEEPIILQDSVLRTLWTLQAIGSTPLVQTNASDGFSPETLSSIEMLRAKFQDPASR